MDTITRSPAAHPKLISLKMRRCPICNAMISKPLFLNTVEGVLELKCPNASCGFTMPILWTGDPAAMKVHETGIRPDYYSESH